MVNLNWPQRFAVIEHFRPTEEQICNAFGISAEEFGVVRQMKATGVFAAPEKTFDASKHGEVFGVKRVVKGPINTTTHKRVVQRVQRANSAPAKRGRQSNKIQTALMQVPDTPVSAEEFSKKHDVSVAVLRQAKRFIEKMSPEDQKAVGTVYVRQDKESKQLMIWRS